MTTVGDVARAALADLGAESTGMVNAVRWVNERISQIAVKRMKHRRKVGSLVVQPALTTGTLTLTNGDPEVVGNAAAIAAWTGRVFDGCFLQLSNQSTWYQLREGTELRLDQPWPGTTVTGASYRIVQRYVTLKPDAAYLGTFVHPRLRRALRTKAQTQLDLHYPDRPYATYGPSYVSEFGESQGKRIIELYPYTTQADYLLYTYWEQTPTLKKEEVIPTCFTIHDLKDGVLADLYRYLASKARMASPPSLELANAYSNLEGRQETKWKATIADVMRRDRGVEDLVLLLSPQVTEQFVNRDARSEVYLRGNRP